MRSYRKRKLPSAFRWLPGKCGDRMHRRDAIQPDRAFVRLGLLPTIDYYAILPVAKKKRYRTIVAPCVVSCSKMLRLENVPKRN